MNGAGKPFVFLTRSVPGAPMILWVGNEKYDIDDGTVVHWHKETGEHIAEVLREYERSTKT